MLFCLFILYNIRYTYSYLHIVHKYTGMLSWAVISIMNHNHNITAILLTINNSQRKRYLNHFPNTFHIFWTDFHPHLGFPIAVCLNSVELPVNKNNVLQFTEETKQHHYYQHIQFVCRKRTSLRFWNNGS